MQAIYEKIWKKNKSFVGDSKIIRTFASERNPEFFLKDNEYDKKYYYLLPAVIAECGGTGTGNYRQCNHRQRKYTDDKAEADGAAW